MRNGGQWTEARFRTFITSALRAASRKWGPRNEVKKKARVERGKYKCNMCKQTVPASTGTRGKRISNVFVDHIDTVVDTVEGFTTWDDFIERLFVEESGLQLLCKACHDKKSKKELLTRRAEKDWPSLTPEYNSWRAMRSRCLFKSHEAYDRYGGAGITICDRWKNSFENFKADMGDRPEGTTLNRIDNTKGYFPENCTWSSYEEQANNRKNNVYLELDGEKKTISQWSRELGIPKSTIQNRLLRGWSEEESLQTTNKKEKQ